jgi:hypothetical protein
MSSAVAFWSAAVTKGDEQKVDVPEGFVLNLQNVALESSSPKASLKLFVSTTSVEGEAVTVLLCTLRAGGVEQCPMQLVFGSDVPTSLSVKGDAGATMHLSGYYQPGPMDMDGYDEGEDDEYLDDEFGDNGFGSMVPDSYTTGEGDQIYVDDVYGMGGSSSEEDSEDDDEDDVFVKAMQARQGISGRVEEVNSDEEEEEEEAAAVLSKSKSDKKDTKKGKGADKAAVKAAKKGSNSKPQTFLQKGKDGKEGKGKGKGKGKDRGNNGGKKKKGDK